MKRSSDSTLRTFGKAMALVLAASLLLSCSTTGGQAGGRSVAVRIGRETFHLEVAADDESRRVGLSGREELAASAGMLFLFEEPQEVAFWMKDTSIPLSLAWVDSAGRITGITDLVPESLEPVYSPGAVIAAIELNQGAFTRAGARLLDRVLIDAIAQD